ncbi:helix-turn-helix domain-containing protein [Tsukamurella soli]|uniref:helix-turn-helix domain-containing protein n=1 Tax=Tsukamurella soli TaxID=644556 RepID=UPI0031E5DC81
MTHETERTEDTAPTHPSSPTDSDWSPYGADLGRRVQALRRERGLSQTQLAERAGLHRNQVSNIERNTSSGDRCSDPHLSTLYRLAASGVPPERLLPQR